MGLWATLRKRSHNKWSHGFLSQVIFILVIFGVVQLSLYQTKKRHIHTAFRAREDRQDSSDVGLTRSQLSTGSNLPNSTRTIKGSVPVELNKTTLGPLNHKDIFVKGKWNSSFVSNYHKHYTVNCAGIVRGNGAAIATATQILKENKPKIPDDTAVKQWVANCSHYRSKRRYPTTPRSAEEAEFPLAYIIVAHEHSSQLERLFRAIYQPQNVYCIHPDAKSPAPFWTAIRSLVECFPNVFVVSKPVDIRYAHSSRLQADINCMSDLLQRVEPWKYVLNLCAQDFPLKTNLELVQQLKAFQGLNDIPGITAPDWFRHRTHEHHEFKKGMMIKRKDIPKPPPPREFKFFFGNAYYAATKNFVHYVIHNETAIDLLRFSEDTYSPDEHYWVTLHRIPGVPGGYPNSSWDSVVRFIHWKGSDNSPECVGKYVREICIFGMGYVQHLARRPSLFANKFHMSFDPIALQCMEELLDYRSVYPESVRDFLPNFPAKHMFGL